MKRSQGRPKESDSFRVTSVFRDQPDIETLGRALIATAKQIVEKQRQGKENSNHK